MRLRAISAAKKGITTVEILLVATFALIIVGSATPLYSKFYLGSQLDEHAHQLLQNIRTAHTRSVARLNNAAHGIYIAQQYIVLYQGTSNDPSPTYATRDNVYDRVIMFPRSITLSTTLSGGDVSFAKATGVPTKTGTVTLTHDIQGAQSIILNSFGMAEIQ